MSEEQKSEIKELISLLLKSEENSQNLTGDNKTLIEEIKLLIAKLPTDSELKILFENEMDKYYAKTKELGNINSMQMIDQYRQTPALVEEDSLALVRTNPTTKPSHKAAFINVAILLYGILNIGFILATALIKSLK